MLLNISDRPLPPARLRGARPSDLVYRMTLTGAAIVTVLGLG